MSNRSKLTETYQDSGNKTGYVMMIIGKQNKARKAKNKLERQNKRRGRR